MDTLNRHVAAILLAIATLVTFAFGLGMHSMAMHRVAWEARLSGSR